MSGLDKLRERAPVSWIRERDVDLLLCGELHAGYGLHDAIATRVGLGGASFEGAWVSVAEINGESDLLLLVSHSTGGHLLLIENKIDAAFQPDQPARYRERADKWREDPGLAGCWTILIAPESYLAGCDQGEFDASITYERLLGAIPVNDDRRAAFAMSTLSEGIESARRGYVMQADEAVTRMWRFYWNLAATEAPELRMDPPGEKPGASTWIYFRRATGLGPERNRKVDVVHKAERGQADLQFRSTAPAELHEATRGVLDPDMTIVKAAKSASLRLDVPAVDFRADTESQRHAITSGLRTCERLRQFYLRNEDALRRLPVLMGQPSNK